MSLLRITLFGQVQIDHMDQAPQTKVTATGQSVLAYLLLQRDRYHPRDVLAGTFWGDRSQKRARRCLNTTLWRLRQALEPDGVPRGTYLQTTPTGEVSFNWDSNHWLDVAAFEEQIDRVLAKPAPTLTIEDVEILKQALDLYTGELLEGYYDDWVLRERERMHRLYMNSLAHLMFYYKYSGLFMEGLEFGQLILDQNPIREEIHREMMLLYLEAGQRTSAIRQYELCTEALDTELGITPMEVTQALYQQILDTPGNVILKNTGFASEPTDLQQALSQLQMARQECARAQWQLQQAIDLVDKLTKR